MAKILMRCIKTRLYCSQWQCCASLKNDRFLHAENTRRSSDVRKTIYKHEEVKKFRVSVISRYLEYVKNYEKAVEKKFPTAMHLYRTFKIGMKEFYRDVKLYLKIIMKLNSTAEGLKSLTHTEIDLYFKMPRNMRKVVPLLVLLALPGTHYIIFPITYYYPRQFLCSHFWTIQQRSEFSIYYLRQRLLYNKPTFRCLQAELNGLKGHPLHLKWKQILGLLGSGVQPTAAEILECKELFLGEPFHISWLKNNHINYLMKMHDIKSLFFKQSRLLEHARLLRALDRALIREGGVRSLSQDALKAASFLRGLNPINMKTEDIEEWLMQWLSISLQLDNDYLSLLLHCPILLGYNQPSNWQLIY